MSIVKPPPGAADRKNKTMKKLFQLLFARKSHLAARTQLKAGQRGWGGGSARGGYN